MIQTRIDERLVTITQRLVVDMLGAANHLGDVVTGELDMQAARHSVRCFVRLEEATDLVHDRLKTTRLISGRRRDRVAVHRVRHPRDRSAILARRLKQRRQHLTDALRTHARDEGQASLLAIRVEAVDEREHLIACRGRTKLDPNRVTHARQQLDMSALLLARPLPHPQEVGRRVVGLARTRINARHRRLILQKQSLMRGIQVHVAQRLKINARCSHELDRAVNVGGQRLVARIRRIRHEALIPTVYLPQIRIAALREGADQVQRRRRMIIQGQEALRVGFARLGSEFERVDRVAAIARQRHAVARLQVGGTRLGVLPRDTTNLDDRQRRTVRQDDSHLQQRLDLQTHVIGGRLREGFGTVSTHQHESLAAGRRTHPRA